MKRNTKTAANSASPLTNQDTFVKLKGLLYGIANIQSRPGLERDFCDLLDLCRITRAMIKEDADVSLLCVAMLEVNRFAEHMPNLWPTICDEEELCDFYTSEELVLKDTIEQTIKSLALACSIAGDSFEATRERFRDALESFFDFRDSTESYRYLLGVCEGEIADDEKPLPQYYSIMVAAIIGMKARTVGWTYGAAARGISRALRACENEKAAA
ncbi:hypothetical protein [Salipiger bermudensis]|uniref:hypothetical protein n=1 Tax=Salipiger bermudensis TaxID=344736 RepID=UPI001CD7BEA1|nr:hypothetical protein [Salipiger bermudensis]MCA1288218.1 hypothetical protein [Salipiger bermudensis]